MLTVLIITPCINFLWLGFFSFFFTKRTLLVFAMSGSFLTFFYSLILFYINVTYGIQSEIEYTWWIHLFLLNISWSIVTDSVICVMLCVVTFISFLVHLYALDYMQKDPAIIKFISYLSLFTFFMLILVTGNNFLQLFLGWEGVGLCSYLLINFWYTRISANKAAIKALVINRIGDIFLLFGFSLIYFYTKSLNYFTIFALIPYLTSNIILFFNYKISVISAICFFLCLGAIGKSAQLGLHMWLPDAMEGPTPVSALIHAATMVTAGIFLIIKCSAIFEYAGSILLIIIFIGSLTAIFASTIGFVQHDIKKIIAYSTCSQLGYMMLVCGLSAYSIGLYHLTTHACFKALLFLVAGSIIHAMADEQDLRKYGGLMHFLPFTYTMLLIGSFALMGFPFLAGYYSKDLILELLFDSSYSFNLFFIWIMGLSTILTAVYSVKIIFRTFWKKPNGLKSNYLMLSESTIHMTIVLFLLAFASIFLGFLGQNYFTTIANGFWGNAIFILPLHANLMDIEFLPFYLKIIPLFYSFGGFFFTYYFYENYTVFSFLLKRNNIYFFFNKKWYIDILQNKLIALPVMQISLFMYRKIDKGFLELFGPKGLNSLFLSFSSNILRLHSMQISNYYLYILFTFLILLFV